MMLQEKVRTQLNECIFVYELNTFDTSSTGVITQKEYRQLLNAKAALNKIGCLLEDDWFELWEQLTFHQMQIQTILEQHRAMQKKQSSVVLPPIQGRLFRKEKKLASHENSFDQLNQLRKIGPRLRY